MIAKQRILGTVEKINGSFYVAADSTQVMKIQGEDPSKTEDYHFTHARVPSNLMKDFDWTVGQKVDALVELDLTVDSVKQIKISEQKPSLPN